MNRPLLVMTAGAVLAFASLLSAGAARAHERCVCTSSEGVPLVPPVPPVAPMAPLPPMPPPPEEGRRHVQKEIIIIGPGGARHVRHIHRVVRVEEDSGGRMTRHDFIKRAERAFDEHDQNHDGVLDDDERGDMMEPGEAPEAIEAPEPPEPPEPEDAPEPPRAPHPPRQ